MAGGHSGRDLYFDWSGTTLAAVRSKGITFTQTPIEVTSDDDNGERAIIAEPAVRFVDITVAGIIKNEILLAHLMSAPTGRTLVNGVVHIPSSMANPGQVSGPMFLNSLEKTGEHDGSALFSANISSAGAMTYTPSATS